MNPSRPLALVAISAAALAVSRPAPADENAAATQAVEQFLSCYEAEDGVVDDEVRALIESLGPELAAGAEGSGSGSLLLGGDCEALAEAWTPVVTPDAVPPDWARLIADAAADRAVACFAELEGRPPTDEEIDALGAYRTTMAQGLASVAHAMGGDVNTDAAGPCADAMASISCDALAQGLSAGGELSLGGGSEACGELFGVDLSRGRLEDAPELDDVRGLEDFVEPAAE